MTRRTLVPIDGSPHADSAVEYACSTHPDAEITALFVLDPFGYYEERSRFLDRLDDWYANLEKRAEGLLAEDEDRPSTATRSRRRPNGAGRAIIEYAVAGEFDAIVIGTHSRTALAGVLLGSTAEKVTRRVP